MSEVRPWRKKQASLIPVPIATGVTRSHLRGSVAVEKQVPPAASGENFRVCYFGNIN